MDQKKLKSIECDPACGFMVRSHEENEVVQMAKKHVKEMHNMDQTDEQMRKMVKTL